MNTTYRFALPVLLTAAFAAACGEGSGSSIATSAGTGPSATGPGATGSGGSNPTGSGPTTTGSAGDPSTGAGGGDTGSAGSSMTGSAGSGAGGAAGSGAAGSGAGGGTAGSGAGGAAGGGTGGSGGAPMGMGINSGAGPWGTPVAGGPTASGTMVTGTVTVNRGSTIGNVGPRFLGYSIEKTHLTNNTIVGSNTRLVALYKLVGPVNLRIGANDVELCNWVAGTPYAAGGPPYGHTIGTVMVDGLNDFLNATGANVIYGLNFSLNNPANDAAEATYAQMKLGANLYGFEIGNELDKYGPWATQRQQYESIATAVATAVPTAKFVGPASTGGGSSSLSAPFATDESAKLGAKLIQLTQHYYLGGAGSTAATVTALQTVKGDIPTIGATMNTAATGAHLVGGWRMDEANSFFSHGQMGVSDTLVAALWTLDLFFVNAGHGAVGVNLHGGETGMDGTRPFYYEPIEESGGMVTAVKPTFYGQLMFYLAGQGKVLATTVNTTNPNFTAYALDYTADGSTSVVMSNKNATTGVQVTVNVGQAVTSASAIYLTGTPAGTLTAPSASVTLAGAAVTPTAAWPRQAPFIQTTSGNTVSVFVPPASAALVRVQ